MNKNHKLKQKKYSAPTAISKEKLKKIIKDNKKETTKSTIQSIQESLRKRKW